MTEENDYLKRSVLANTNWIDKTLWTGILICAVVIVLRLIGDDTFSFQGAKIPLTYTWIILAILTVCHLYATVMFRISARKLWIERDEQTCNEVWNQVISDGGMFMRGMRPRLLPESGGGTAHMGNEPATWLTHICAVGMFVAIVPFEWSFSWRTLAALLLVIINWGIGSHWAIALSELSVPKDHSILLAGRTRRRAIKIKEARILYQDTTHKLIDSLVLHLESRRTAMPLKELTQISRRLDEGLLDEKDFQALVEGCVKRLSETSE